MIFAAIFHPFVFKKEIRQWYPRPHFHLVGFGSEQKIKQAFGKYGWYVKDKEERKSTFQTFCYLLSHAGVKKVLFKRTILTVLTTVIY